MKQGCNGHKGGKGDFLCMVVKGLSHTLSSTRCLILEYDFDFRLFLKHNANTERPARRISILGLHDVEATGVYQGELLFHQASRFKLMNQGPLVSSLATTFEMMNHNEEGRIVPPKVPSTHFTVSFLTSRVEYIIAIAFL